MTISKGVNSDVYTSQLRHRKHGRDYYHRHKEKILAKRALRKITGEANIMQEERIKRDSLLRRRYGITQEEYFEILTKQNNCCAVCNTASNGKYNFFDVDHDHVTKQVRGLLCRQCNVMLGQIEKLGNEKLRQAISYYLKTEIVFPNREIPVDVLPDPDELGI